MRFLLVFLPLLEPTLLPLLEPKAPFKQLFLIYKFGSSSIVRPVLFTTFLFECLMIAVIYYKEYYNDVITYT